MATVPIRARRRKPAPQPYPPIEVIDPDLPVVPDRHSPHAVEASAESIASSSVAPDDHRGYLAVKLGCYTGAYAALYRECRTLRRQLVKSNDELAAATSELIPWM